MSLEGRHLDAALLPKALRPQPWTADLLVQWGAVTRYGRRCRPLSRGLQQGAAALELEGSLEGRRLR